MTSLIRRPMAPLQNHFRGWIMALCLGLALLLMGFGGKVQLDLADVHTTPCPDAPEYSNLFTSGSSMEAQCLFIEGTVNNPTDSLLYNADVFGRVYDANGNDVLPERTRLGAIEQVPSGESPFSIRISVPTTNPLPLSLEQFKASGFRGRVRR